MSQVNQSIVAALIVMGVVGAAIGVRNAIEKSEMRTQSSFVEEQSRLTLLPSVHEVHTEEGGSTILPGEPSEEEVRQAVELSQPEPAPVMLTSGEVTREVAQPQGVEPIVPVAPAPLDMQAHTIGDASPSAGAPLSKLPPEEPRASIDPELLDRQIAAQRQQLEWLALEIMGTQNAPTKAMLIVSYNNLSAQLGEAITLRESLVDGGL